MKGIVYGYLRERKPFEKALIIKTRVSMAHESFHFEILLVESFCTEYDRVRILFRGLNRKSRGGYILLCWANLFIRTSVYDRDISRRGPSFFYLLPNRQGSCVSYCLENLQRRSLKIL